MLSILIPTYNYNCLELIKRLNEQALKANINYEIIVMDDCSPRKKTQNLNINRLDNCQYIELTTNNGRSKIRNMLADKAKYDNLLFLDCDAAVCSDSFIQNYVEFCKEENIVVCGGRTYKEQPPKNKKFYLHWLYGSKREVIPIKERQKNASHSFMSNNFLISKKIFNSIRFNENIRSYGHEDTLFGFELRIREQKIIHIENPLLHIGLESARQVIKKEKDSIHNLLLICNALFSLEEMANEIKLLSYCLKIKNLHLSKPLSLFYQLFHKSIERNLTGNLPSLFLLDTYKLSYFFYLKTKYEN